MFWDFWRKNQEFLASDSIENHPPTTTQSTWYTPYAAANVPTTTPKRTEKVWYLKIENWKYKSTLFNQHTPKINLCEFCASLFTSQPGIKEGTPPPHQHHHSRWNSVVQCYMPIVYAISKEKEHLTQYLSFLHLFYWFLHIFVRDLRPSVPAIPQSAGIDVVKYENSKIITSPAQISFNTYRNTIEWRGLRKKCQKTSFLAILPLVLVIENHGKRAILVSQDPQLVPICLRANLIQLLSSAITHCMAW